MKLIIAGSRTTPPNLALQIDRTIAAHGWDVSVVVSGGCRGPDSWGEEWAAENDKLIRRFLPDWDTYGKAAGPIRNRAMADYADALLVFWDFTSRGTKNMIDEMRQRGKTVSVIGFGGRP